MTRVLVTGAGGFVGSHVIEAVLARTDWDVIAVDSFRHNGAVDRMLDALGADWGRVALLVHDLTAPFSPSQIRAMGDVEHIVNVASRCHVGQSIERPAEFIANNVNLMLTMLELAREIRPRKLVHFSTDEVYGPFEPISTLEHTPSSPYAASKAAQEDICHAYRRTYGIPVLVLNSANMFGERQSQLAFIPRVIGAVSRGEEVQIHCHKGVPGARHYTYVRNVAHMVTDILAADSGYAAPRVVLRGQQRMNNLELARCVAELLGKELRYTMVEAQKIRPGYDPHYADLENFGWDAKVAFDEGLRRTIKWAQANPNALAA